MRDRSAQGIKFGSWRNKSWTKIPCPKCGVKEGERCKAVFNQPRKFNFNECCKERYNARPVIVTVDEKRNPRGWRV